MVDIRDFCKITGQNIDIKYFSKRQVWSAKIEGAEIMDNGMLLGAHEESREGPEEAVINYARRIAGQRIAIKAYTDKRQEFDVPDKLTYKGY